MEPGFYWVKLISKDMSAVWQVAWVAYGLTVWLPGTPTPIPLTSLVFGPKIEPPPSPG